MPGLFGIVRKTSRLSPESVWSMSRRMGAALRTESRLVLAEAAREGYAGGRVSSGLLNPEPRPLRAGRYLAWVDGEVFPTPDGPGQTPPGRISHACWMTPAAGSRSRTECSPWPASTREPGSAWDFVPST